MSLRKQLNNPTLILRCWKVIYSGKAREKRAHSKGIDNVTIESFRDDEKNNLLKLSTSLRKNTYKISSLKGFAEKKQTIGKYRLITAATITDRIIHKTILSLINPIIYPYINTEVSYCGVKRNILNEKSSDTLNTKKAVEMLIYQVKKGNLYIFKSDISAFYDNIPKRKLFNIVKSLLRDTSLNNLIRDVIFFKLGNKEEFTAKHVDLLPKKYVGISQGSPLSQLFANIYLADFDNKMKTIYGKRFIRYIDDFIVLVQTKDEAIEAEKLSKKFLFEKKLFLSPDFKKTYYVDLRKQPLTFLGLRINNKQISSKMTKEEATKWTTNLEAEINPKLSIMKKVKIMNDKLRGQENYLKHYHSEAFFQTINKQVRHIKRIKKSKYLLLEELNIKKTKPIISLKDWQSILK